MMMFLSRKHVRPLVVASSLLGFCLIAGCNSGGSNGESVAPGAVSPRFKKLQDAKAKADAAKK